MIKYAYICDIAWAHELDPSNGGFIDIYPSKEGFIKANKEHMEDPDLPCKILKVKIEVVDDRTRAIGNREEV